MDSGSSSRKKAAPAPAPAAPPSNKTIPAPAPAPAAPPAKKAAPAPAAWGRLPAAAGALAGVPVMGGAEYWPALSGGMVMPASAAAPPAAAAPSPPQPTSVAASIGNPGASRTDPGDRRAPERRGAVSEQSPAHAPNHRSNGGAPGHQSGRFPQHPHGRGGYNGGSRRGIGGGISIGNAIGSASVNVNGNGGGVRHGQEHRGGFDGQRRGRVHQDGHGPGRRQPGPQMPFARAPRPFPAQLPPPPPPPLFASPTLPFYGAYYGPMIGYAHPEFAPGFYVPPPPDALHFVPYPALPVHVMLPHMEQQAAHPHMEEQQAVQPHVEEPEAAQLSAEELKEHVEEPEAAQLSAEKLEEELRKQIEFYFSENNLCADPFLKQQMNEEGWVPLNIIAGFKRVSSQTTDLEIILKSVSSSTEVEVQDGKIRRRTGWEKYVLRRNNLPNN